VPVKSWGDLPAEPKVTAATRHFAPKPDAARAIAEARPAGKPSTIQESLKMEGGGGSSSSSGGGENVVKVGKKG
jgi:hypothetical protein